MADPRPGVLIVDDDRTTRLVLQRTLERWGYPVVAAGDGEEGWAAIQRHGGRILLTDWEMPRLSGPELCRRVRQAGGERYVYCVILTLRESKADLVAALEAGADDFVRKPFDPAELRVRLEVACRVLRLEDELRARNRELDALNRHLAEAASTDPLMGLGNRRAFEEAATRFHGSARRHREPYSALMLDVDCFKAYNDRYGHPAGDAILRAVGRAVRTNLRAEDEAFRYGGEELVVLLPRTAAAAAAPVGERLRRAVVDLGLPHGGGPGGVVSVSIGGAANDPRAPLDGWAGVVERADQALYEAKRGGRNRVVVWSGARAALAPEAAA